MTALAQSRAALPAVVASLWIPVSQLRVYQQLGWRHDLTQTGPLRRIELMKEGDRWRYD